MRRLLSALSLSSVLLFSAAAHADTVTFSGSPVDLTASGSLDTLVFGAGTFDIVGGVVSQSGFYFAGVTPGLTVTLPFSFTEDVTVGGITHTLTFTGSDQITQTGNLVTLDALGPVSFGSTTFTFLGFSSPVTDNSKQTYYVSAVLSGPRGGPGLSESPVPEPSTLALCGTGILAVAAAARRKLRIA